MYHKFLQYESLNYAAKSFDVDEGENIEIKYKWFMFVWDEVELEHNIRYFDDVIITSRRETQMGDQVNFISYPLKFDLV